MDNEGFLDCVISLAGGGDADAMDALTRKADNSKCWEMLQFFAHNHPSGSLEFSKQDYLFFEGLADAGRLLNIRVLDSMVISRQGFVSMRHLAPEIFARPAKERARAKLAGEQDGFPR